MHERESHSTSHQHHNSSHSAHAQKSTSTSAASMIPAASIKNYNINIQFDPATPHAGKQTHLNLIVTEQEIGEIIKQFDIIHDKLMHLIIINSEDLSHFAQFIQS